MQMRRSVVLLPKSAFPHCLQVAKALTAIPMAVLLVTEMGGDQTLHAQPLDRYSAVSEKFTAQLPTLEDNATPVPNNTRTQTHSSSCHREESGTSSINTQPGASPTDGDPPPTAPHRPWEFCLWTLATATIVNPSDPVFPGVSNPTTLAHAEQDLIQQMSGQVLRSSDPDSVEMPSPPRSTDFAFVPVNIEVRSNLPQVLRLPVPPRESDFLTPINRPLEPFPPMEVEVGSNLPQRGRLPVLPPRESDSLTPINSPPEPFPPMEVEVSTNLPQGGRLPVPPEESDSLTPINSPLEPFRPMEVEVSTNLPQGGRLPVLPPEESDSLTPINSPPEQCKPETCHYSIEGNLVQLVNSDGVETVLPSASEVDLSLEPNSQDPLTANSPENQNRGQQRRDDRTPAQFQFQGVYLFQGDEASARARVIGTYSLSPNALLGGSIDVTDGQAFSDSETEGVSANELYLAVSLPDFPNLRFALGQIDLTSYFDRNSFAKDGATHFFNTVFQTNPALSRTGIGSRTSVLANWTVTDNFEFKVAGFSSSRRLEDFQMDGLAAELGVRTGNAIIRGTYVTDRDAGIGDGFREIFQVDRGGGRRGLRSGDREQSYGVNAEVFIPELSLGLFARYGHYENLEIDEGGDTYSFGINVLDLFLDNDRLGIGYGQELSNDRLRQRVGDEKPDVLEVFYDFRLFSNLRVGFSVQSMNEFSDTIFGIRVKTEFDMTPLNRNP